MTDYTPAATGTGARARVQRFGAFLAGMVMPNLGAFIAFGLITVALHPRRLGQQDRRDPDRREHPDQHGRRPADRHPDPDPDRLHRRFPGLRPPRWRRRRGRAHRRDAGSGRAAVADRDLAQRRRGDAPGLHRGDRPDHPGRLHPRPVDRVDPEEVGHRDRRQGQGRLRDARRQLRRGHHRRRHGGRRPVHRRPDHVLDLPGPRLAGERARQHGAAARWCRSSSSPRRCCS